MGVDRTGKPGPSFAVTNATDPVESPPPTPAAAAPPTTFTVPELRRPPREVPVTITATIATPHQTARPDAANLKSEQARIAANVHPNADVSLVSGFVARVASALS